MYLPLELPLKYLSRNSHSTAGVIHLRSLVVEAELPVSGYGITPTGNNKNVSIELTQEIPNRPCSVEVNARTMLFSLIKYTLQRTNSRCRY